MASTAFQILLAHKICYAVFVILFMLLLPSGLIGCSRKQVYKFLITDHQQIMIDTCYLCLYTYIFQIKTECCHRRFPIYSS